MGGALFLVPTYLNKEPQRRCSSGSRNRIGARHHANVRRSETRGRAGETVLLSTRDTAAADSRRGRPTDGELCAADRAKRYKSTIMTEKGPSARSAFSASKERDFRYVVAVWTNRTQRRTVPGGGEVHHIHRRKKKSLKFCGAVRVDRLIARFNRELDREAPELSKHIEIFRVSDHDRKGPHCYLGTFWTVHTMRRLSLRTHLFPCLICRRCMKVHHQICLTLPRYIHDCVLTRSVQGYAILSNNPTKPD